MKKLNLLLTQSMVLANEQIYHFLEIYEQNNMVD